MHTEFMKAALYQAFRGKGFCSPNPAVGAVLVSEGVIVAGAFHEGPGNMHAEVAALQKLPSHIREVTLYVTLEPCNHWGRTAPCTNAIIDSAVKTVVYGYADPNPLVRCNDTPNLLREAGINVVFFPLPEIIKFYRGYAYWSETARPFVFTKIAQSLDGKIAGPSGARLQISNTRCRQHTLQCRRYSDVILTTARTVKQDNPVFQVSFQGQVFHKPIAILDRTLSLTEASSLFHTGHKLHVYYDEGLPLTSPIRDVCYHPIALDGGGQLDLKAVFLHLGTLGFHEVWVEAGGILFSALHRQKLVHETFVYIAPMVLGEAALSAYLGEEWSKTFHAALWEPMDDNVMVHWVWEN